MSSKQVCAVLFDYGQVLSLSADPEQWERMKRVSGLGESALREGYWKYRHAYDRGDLNALTYWNQIASDCSLEFAPAAVAELIDADVALWAGINTPMVEWAQSLQRAGIKTGILSNIGDAMAAGLRARFDWISAFDHHVWSHELNLAKPEPEIYMAAAEGLGCAPQEVLFIDDKQENIDAAHAVGMMAIRYDLKDHAGFEQQMAVEGLGWLLHPEKRN